MKNYQNPNLTIIFVNTDIITTSSGEDEGEIQPG